MNLLLSVLDKSSKYDDGDVRVATGKVFDVEASVCLYECTAASEEEAISLCVDHIVANYPDLREVRAVVLTDTFGDISTKVGKLGWSR